MENHVCFRCRPGTCDLTPADGSANARAFSADPTGCRGMRLSVSRIDPSAHDQRQMGDLPFRDCIETSDVYSRTESVDVNSCRPLFGEVSDE